MKVEVTRDSDEYLIKLMAEEYPELLALKELARILISQKNINAYRDNDVLSIHLPITSASK